jgi:hypothetical protein
MYETCAPANGARLTGAAAVVMITQKTSATNASRLKLDGTDEPLIFTASSWNRCLGGFPESFSLFF